MKTYFNYILSFILFLACANVADLQGQETLDNKVVVHLKNGSQFEGKLLDWDQETDILVFEIFGKEIKFPNSDIKKIVQVGIDYKPVYNFKETGPYYHLRLNMITGNPGRRENFEPGIGLSVSAGKRFNRLLSIGGGLGFDEYIVRTSENILSTFAEVSGYFFESNQSLSYNVGGGYGFAFKDEDRGITHAKGGWMIHPSLGLRLGKKDLKWTFDVGYKFQKANWVYENWGTISDQRILYRRLTLRTGIMF